MFYEKPAELDEITGHQGIGGGASWGVCTFAKDASEWGTKGARKDICGLWLIMLLYLKSEKKYMYDSKGVEWEVCVLKSIMRYMPNLSTYPKLAGRYAMFKGTDFVSFYG